MCLFLIDTRSEHRIVRDCFHIRIMRERNKLIRKPRFPTTEELEIRRETYEQEIEQPLHSEDAHRNLVIERLNSTIKEKDNSQLKKTLPK